MSSLLVFLLVILAAGAALLMMIVGIYNGLIQARNAYQNAFAQIDVQLHRRYDLIPNLVEIAKTYMAHERETLEAVTRARATALSSLNAAKAKPGDASTMATLSGAESGLGAALGRLMMVSESYPELKADKTMMQLTEELTSTENKVAFARQAYNDQVMHYNNQREVFPNSLIAGTFNFLPAAFLEITTDEAHKRDAPKVSFS